MGAKPPFLAGRETEKRLFRDFLTDLAGRIAPGTSLILHGPRGNGKTVLLGWLRDAARRSAGVETLTLRPAEIPNEARLGELLAPQSWWRRLGSGQLTLGGSPWKPASAPPAAPGDLLAGRTRKHGLVILVDEAHTLDLAVGRALLGAAQEVGAELPCLLVLAGTPNLEGRLRSMEASFWSRATILRIGRLRDEATREALVRPFAAEGIAVADAALRIMLRHVQNYPFFVQLMGSAAWKQCPPGSERPRVTTAAVERVLPEFRRTKREYYRHRVEELIDRDLLPVALSVAEAFRTRPSLSDGQLRNALARSPVHGVTSRERADAMRALRDLGFLWRVEGELRWEPGIPSLMDYTREAAASA